MRISDAGLRLIRKNESSKNTMYHDQAGLPTIGVGHLLTKDELSSGKLISLKVPWYNGLTDEQVDSLLKADTLRVELAINSWLRVPVTQFEFDALASFVFNIGAHAFAHSTLLRDINDDKFDAVSAEMRKWIYSKSQIVPDLIPRREREIAMWEGVPS